MPIRSPPYSQHLPQLLGNINYFEGVAALSAYPRKYGQKAIRLCGGIAANVYSVGSGPAYPRSPALRLCVS